MNKLSRALLASLKKIERRPDPRAFISIGITVKGSPTPIIHYSERELEERVTCSACTLQYTIYGAFGFCPDCGVHNSLQIANADLGPRRQDARSGKERAGRCRRQAWSTGWRTRFHASTVLAASIARHFLTDSFQNIEGARDKLLKESALDIAAGVDLARSENRVHAIPEASFAGAQDGRSSTRNSSRAPEHHRPCSAARSRSPSRMCERWSMICGNYRRAPLYRGIPRP